jgi:hypothetical protein
MAPSETVSKQKVKIYTVVIEILLYQLKFKCDTTIKYFFYFIQNQLMHFF